MSKVLLLSVRVLSILQHFTMRYVWLVLNMDNNSVQWSRSGATLAGFQLLFQPNRLSLACVLAALIKARCSTLQTSTVDFTLAPSYREIITWREG